MRRVVVLLFSLLALLFGRPAMAAGCSAVFPQDLAENHDNALQPLTSDGDNIDWGKDRSLAISGGANTGYDNFFVGKDFTLTVSGSGTARLHIKGNAELGNKAWLNESGDPSQLVIYVGGNLTIKKKAVVNAYIYVGGNIDIKDSDVFGALSAGGNITLDNKTSVTYDGPGLADADFAGMCTSSLSDPGDARVEYTFDQCSLATQVTDARGQYHAIATNADSTDSTAQVGGRSLDLSATSSNDWVTVPKGAVDDLNDFTFMTWLKTNHGASQQEIFHALGSSTGDDELEIYLDPGSTDEIVLSVRDRQTRLWSDIDLNDDAWHHVAVTRDGDDVCLVVDGQQQDCDNNSVNSGSLDIREDHSVVIGQEQDSFRSQASTDGDFDASQSFVGYLDELKFYSSELTTSQVAQIYANESAGKNADGTTRTPENCTPTAPAYRITGQDSSLSHQSSDWSWDGSQLAPWRQAMENTTNFGEGGTVDKAIQTVDLPALTSENLNNIDAFVSSWWWNGESASYDALLENFFRGGGDLVLFQDDTDRDGIGQRLGIETIAGMSGNATISAPLQGAFGTVGSLSPRGEMGHLNNSEVTAKGGTICGVDGAGQAVAACWDEGVFAPGSGKLVIVTDTDFVTGNYGSASFNPHNDKGRFALNILDFLINGGPTPPPGGQCDYRDNFSVAGFANQDGSKQWSANWTEYDDAGAGTASGYVQVTGGQLVLNNYVNGENNNRPGVSRRFSLAGATSAVLSYQYQLSSAVDSGDRVEVTISDDNGNSWTTVETITGKTGGQYSNSIDLASISGLSMTGDMVLSLRISDRTSDSGCCYGGSGETIAFDYVSVVSEGNCEVSALSYFTFEFGGASASTCVAKPVTISAYSADNQLLSNYSGTVSLSTSTAHGNWQADAAIASRLTPNPDTDDNGAAQFSFTDSDNGQVVLNLANSHADNLTISASANGVNSTSAQLSYSDNTLVITEDSLTVAGKPQQLSVAMWRKDPSSGVCGIATEYNSNSQPLKTWVARTALTSAAAPTIGSLSVPSAQPASANLSLNFSNGPQGPGSAAFTLNTTDVGQYRLQLLDDSRQFATGSDIAGGTGLLTVRPFGFDLDFYHSADGDDDNFDQRKDLSQDKQASYANSATGSAFHQAGVFFPMQVSAVQWRADDDTDNNGFADNDAFLGDNPVTASFGSEPTAQSLILSHGLQLPTGGALGTLSVSNATPLIAGGSASIFIAGQAQIDVAWSEVGIISLYMAMTNYLDDADGDAFHRIHNVGRFYPAQYGLSNPRIFARHSPDAICSNNFSYMGEPFYTLVNLTAQNQQGATTTNYDGDFVRLNTVGQFSSGAYGENLLFDRGQVNSLDITWSSGQASDVQVGLQVNRGSDLDGPYNLSSSSGLVRIGLLAKDSDDSRLTGDDPLGVYQLIGTHDLRYGRLFLDNAFGPENAPLSMEVQAQYWDKDKQRFVLNSDDNCSRYDERTLTFSPNLSGISGPVEKTVVKGSGHLLLTTPGERRELSVSLPLAPTVVNGLDSWLGFDWQGNGQEGPTGVATFGQYRGNDRVIYWREVQ